MLELRQVFPEH